MRHRFHTIVLALVAGLSAADAFAQTRGITVVTPAAASMPLGAGAPALPGRTSAPGAEFGVNPFGPALTEALPRLVPTLTIAPSAVTPSRLATAIVRPAPAKAFVSGAADRAAAPAVKAAGPSARATLEAGAKALAVPGAQASAVGASNLLRAAFDGGAAADGPEEFRVPGWSENARINDAVRRLYDSPTGREVYDYVWKRHGQDLRISIDDDPNAAYDERMGTQDGRPVLTLTRDLVEKQSAEVLASYIVRGLADLYNAAFPPSVEKTYLTYSRQVRAYAELTGSGVDGRWDQSRDQWNGNGYVLQTYYKFWRQVVTDFHGQGRDVQASQFFRFLRDSDDSTTDPDAKLTLRERYDRGDIPYATYDAMSRYLREFLDAESRWLNQTRR